MAASVPAPARVAVMVSPDSVEDAMAYHSSTWALAAPQACPTAEVRLMNVRWDCESFTEETLWTTWLEAYAPWLTMTIITSGEWEVVMPPEVETVVPSLTIVPLA